MDQNDLLYRAFRDLSSEIGDNRGVDIDTRETLIAANHPTEEIAKIVGADSIHFLSIEDVKKITGGDGTGFCYACFDGLYPTKTPTNAEKSRFERKISTNPKFADRYK